jgi:hypothetical protein
LAGRFADVYPLRHSHNGHSNSFAALLEILDPQRFCRGVPVRSKKLLDAVMVRRLKQDLRRINEPDFPNREVVPVIVMITCRSMRQNSSSQAVAGLPA